MIIAIKKQQDNSIYIDKNLRTEIDYVALGFTLKNIDDKYNDCEDTDFNEDFTFNVEKYIARKQSYLDENRKVEIQIRLNQLSQDFVQSLVGAYFEDLEQRKEEFKALHNELRIIKGKQPRTYI